MPTEKTENLSSINNIYGIANTPDEVIEQFKNTAIFELLKARREYARALRFKNLRNYREELEILNLLYNEKILKYFSII